MIKDWRKKPCVLEYSEEQGVWHHNDGHNEVGSNGYHPMALGSAVGITNLSRIVHEREGKERLTLKEANDLIFKCLYDYADILPEVFYIPLKREKQ